MSIIINNKEINKTDLLHFISQNKLSAIIFFRGQTKIGLKDAKEIIESLERDPNFYDGVHLKIKKIFLVVTTLSCIWFAVLFFYSSYFIYS